MKFKNWNDKIIILCEMKIIFQSNFIKNARRIDTVIKLNFLEKSR